jgi:hypothetical protein
MEDGKVSSARGKPGKPWDAKLLASVPLVADMAATKGKGIE